MADELIVLENLLPEIAQALKPLMAEVLKIQATEVEALAKAQAPVATGFLQSSIYSVTKDSSTYGQGVTGGEKGSFLLPEIEHPSSDQEVYVSAAADYAVYVEYGTSKMPAQPFLTPAAEAMANGSGGDFDFEGMLAKLIGL